MIFDSLSIVTIMSEVIFLAALGRFAWKNREKKLLFWGWLAVIAMIVTIDVVYFGGFLK
ncbi:MAG TPA: hypothetical protein VN943_15030 [Candidatus Acidoferrum sp.]|nr:hypothetical protein [Candidatus Acidoferrum sp.]